MSDDEDNNNNLSIDNDNGAGLPRFVEPEYNLDNSRLEVKEAEPDPCCTRCTSEWRYSWFAVQEGEKVLDIQASFGPRTLMVRLMKLCYVILFNGSLVALLYRQRNLEAFWLAFLTHWSMLFCCLWTVVSFINSLIPLRQPKRTNDSVSLWIKFSWLLFPVASCFAMIVTLLYWTMDYKPEVSNLDYLQVFIHAGVILVIPEGLIINRIPVRLKHMILVMFLAACYVAWMAIHQMLTDIGNPNNKLNRDNVTDDQLYSAVDFEEEAVFSSILVIAVVLVLTPALYFLLWLLSLCSFPCGCRGYNRRYLAATDKPDSSAGGNSSARIDNVNIYEK